MWRCPDPNHVVGGGEQEIREGEKWTPIDYRKEFRFQLHKVSDDHKTRFEIAEQQIKLYASDFEKERAQREKLLAENDTLKTKNVLLLQENSFVIALQQVSTFELICSLKARRKPLSIGQLLCIEKGLYRWGRCEGLW